MALVAGSGSGAVGDDSSNSEAKRGVRTGGGRLRCVAGWTAACGNACGGDRSGSGVIGRGIYKT
jgi:hypothetical protein